MDLVIEAARPDEWAAVFSFLETMGLPTAGLADHLSGVLVSRAGRRIVGTAALEVYGKAALLRSVAVSEDRRGRGLGTALVQRALELGRQQGVENFYLLTETAQGFFRPPGLPGYSQVGGARAGPGLGRIQGRLPRNRRCHEPVRRLP
jgi:amino-acid N-acetyltransferase